ncbi:hypothetical protein ANRL1_04374 [Anaerolineae bacterium]|nr:hypothetical protein ANRL1_04374 [Anaerolineae bacterium]
MMRQIPIQDLQWRHTAFLSMQPVDRPLLGIWVGDYYFTSQFPHGVSRWQPGAEITPQELTFEQFLPDYRNLYELHERLNDDFFYVGSAYPGLPWMEAIMGCRVNAEESSTWTTPFLSDYAQLEELRPVGESPWFRKLIELTSALVEWADGRFPVNAPLLRGPADIAAAMRGSTQFVMDFYDNPEGVKQLLDLCAQARKQVMQAILDIVKPFHSGLAAGGYPSKLWTPGKTCLYNQEDAAAVLSPRIFERFLLPLEDSIATQADLAYIHLHSSCLYPVDILLRDSNYSVLQVNYDHDGSGPRLPAILPTLKKILEQRPLILWGEFTLDEMKQLATLGSRGLSLQPIVANEQEARACQDAVLRIWQSAGSQVKD